MKTEGEQKINQFCQWSIQWFVVCYKWAAQKQPAKNSGLPFLDNSTPAHNRNPIVYANGRIIEGGWQLDAEIECLHGGERSENKENNSSISLESVSLCKSLSVLGL